MSADAKAWPEESSEGYYWNSIDDWEPDHHFGGTLAQVLTYIDSVVGGSMRWEIREYPDGTSGLVGYL